MTMNRVLRSVVLVISLVVSAGWLTKLNAAAQSEQDVTRQTDVSSAVQLRVEPEDRAAATIGTSGVRYHLNLAHTPAAKGVEADFPPIQFPQPVIPDLQSSPTADSESAVAGSVLSPPPPAFYPADVTKLVSTGKTIASAKSHPIFINCSTPPLGSCWGSPQVFLSNLGASTFIHLVDQYVGSTAANRYTLGTIFTASETIFAGTSGVPTLSENDILALVHSAAKAAGTGYGHVYHVFIPQGVDTCMDEGPCYSPDNPATSVFCAYHFTVHFSDIGTVYYSVEPFQDVAGCAVPPGSPNGALIDSTASTLSHELFESITDPDIHTGFRALNSGAVLGSEIGDLCGGVLFGIVPLNTKNYGIQLEYSDFYHACASTP
jgi:hypothetical protein